MKDALPVQNTRDALLQAAGRLFTMYGIRGVQAKEIAAACGAVPNAITYHFGGLDGLIEAVWDYALANMDYARLDTHYEENRHLLKSRDGQRQLVAELIGILFELIWSGDDSHWVNLFLLNATMTPEGQQRVEKRVSNRMARPLLRLYQDITGDGEPEAALAWAFTVAGGAAIYSTHTEVFRTLLHCERLPGSCYRRIRHVTIRNAWFSLGLLPE